MKNNMEINREAVLHIPLSNYAFAESETRLTIRIRTQKDNVTACTLYYGDRACTATPVVFKEIMMEIKARDEFFDYFEAAFETPFSRVCYYFKLQNEGEWTYYYSERFTKELAVIYFEGEIMDGRSEYYQYPYILKNEIPDVPAWFKKAVVYNIFPDSFACGKYISPQHPKDVVLDNGKVCKSRLGGTLKGIFENLDYIQGLGFNCIYLNPIFAGGEYHKYDTIDYYHIDPCFGTNEDFKHLVEEIHKREMKIIIDGVFNHCSWEFFAFVDVMEKGKDSKYKNWFYELKLPVRRPQSENEKPDYACFAYERKMPKLNTSNEEVQEYFANVGAYWIREYKADGWRLDVANEIDRNFWRRFRGAVKRQNKEAILIGEVWENAESWLRGDIFDSTMNYEFRRICRDHIIGDHKNALTAAKQLEQMRLRYPTNLVNGQMNLLDSHDVPRFLSLCRGDQRKWKLACILLMLFPGVPSLFYGDEQAICGIKENEYRNPMVWGENPQLCEFVQNMIEIRKKYIEESATYEVLWKDTTQQVFTFVREGRKGRLFVSLNIAETGQKWNREERKIILASSDEEFLEAMGYKIYL
ncbi:alpha-glycosidase [Lacrimispora amygdalina]|uniref:Alpha-glycosidase n=1 Tax=Lacrimispora amygdalina TaxID=253257 RepID=A0A3E2NAQ9_9FIRM|nr:glycoside hydrolase family 13 protein [Clostridium indicum]RFZ78076.1 alpha-glycosidase [Clostridium indicum]